MAITRTPQIDDDGSGTTGTIWNNAWKQELYNQIDGSVGGLWTPSPFNAANFTAASGTWTVSGAVVNIAWTKIADHVGLVTFSILGPQTISLSTTSLYINVPAMPGPILAATNACNTPFHYTMGGAIGTGYVELMTSRQLRLLRDATATPFPIITNSTANLFGQVFFPC